jgi:hypothetical protein
MVHDLAPCVKGRPHAREQGSELLVRGLVGLPSVVPLSGHASKSSFTRPCSRRSSCRARPSERASSISTDDTGGGGLNGYSAVWQNLCLNLIMIDVAKTGAFNIRHIGDHGKLVAQFRAGFRRALDSLEHFRRAWGYAVAENIHRTRARSKRTSR